MIDDFQMARRRMVKEQLEARGIHDAALLQAMNKVPREAFITSGLRDQAYKDHPLHIGEGQTISQPYVVAEMTQELQLTGKEKVLEIGTGSGYQTAILMELAHEVYSVERIATMSYQARKNLFKFAYDGFHLRVGDGTLGWPEAAPFDAIIVTAAGPSVSPALKEQLAEGGRLVVPSGPRNEQELIVYQRCGSRFLEKKLGQCRFVKLVGEYGWTSE
jgi:protein-L-isoaspartate(D-aspartate) O-methyltransferase